MLRALHYLGSRVLGASLGSLCWLVITTQAHADLSVKAAETSDKIRYLLISGSFAHSDRLLEFEQLLRSHSPAFVTFNSPGGNLAKGIEVGRLIRRYGVDTVQIRGLECASACALAFLGGVRRIADPGSIGVHKSSFSSQSGLSMDEAVSAVQSLTALTMSYVTEMGADPLLLQLALKYDADDIRYLSKSEMRQFRVTNDDTREAINTDKSTGLGQPASSLVPLSKPYDGSTVEPRTGRIRHPKGYVSLKAAPDQTAPDLTILRNSFGVSIASNENSWYRVQVGTNVGYLHSTWVRVDQFYPSKFDDRYIQIKSLPTLPEVNEFIRSSTLNLAAFLTPNGWYAITLKDGMALDQAQPLLDKLKSEGRVPSDAFVTYGNAYMRQACCK